MHSTAWFVIIADCGWEWRHVRGYDHMVMPAEGERQDLAYGCRALPSEFTHLLEGHSTPHPLEVTNGVAVSCTVRGLPGT